MLSMQTRVPSVFCVSGHWTVIFLVLIYCLTSFQCFVNNNRIYDTQYFYLYLLELDILEDIQLHYLTTFIYFSDMYQGIVFTLLRLEPKI